MNHDPSAVTDDNAEGLAELVQGRSGVDASEENTEPGATAVEPEGAQGSEFELELEVEPVGKPDDEPAATPDIEPDADALDAEPVAAEALERELTPGGEPEPELAVDEPPLEDDVEIVGLEAALAVPAVVPVDHGGHEFEIVESSDPRAVREHAVDLRLARLHLRTGAVQLARAELESLAVLRALDRDAHLDLAEARWRGGDLLGAGDAVVQYLENGGTDPLAYVIAAEASAAMGRLADARRLARRALDRLTVPLERVFAGQTRSEVWPGATDAEIQPVSTLFAPLAPDAVRGGRIGVSGPSEESLTHIRPLEPLLASGQMDPWDSLATGETAPPPDFDLLPLGLDLAATSPASALSEAEVHTEIDAAHAAIAEGEFERATGLLADVLRARPGLLAVALEAVTTTLPPLEPADEATREAPAEAPSIWSAPPWWAANAEIRVEPEPVVVEYGWVEASQVKAAAAAEALASAPESDAGEFVPEPSFDDEVGGWPSPFSPAPTPRADQAGRASADHPPASP